MTLDEGLRWMGTLKLRHTELVGLRNVNSKESYRYIGDREAHIEKPVYDIKILDKTVNQVAKEIRKLDEAIKKTNAVTTIVDYTKDEAALGEVS